jgi:hypothetical protein
MISPIWAPWKQIYGSLEEAICAPRRWVLNAIGDTEGQKARLTEKARSPQQLSRSIRSGFR